MAPVRWYLPPLLFAAAPLVTVIGANLGAVPLRSVVIARSLLLVAATVVAVLWALRLLQRDLGARAAWLSWFLVLFNLYGATARGFQVLSLPVSASDAWFAVAWVVMSGAIATLATRPWEKRPRDAMPLTVTAVLFLLVALAPAAAGNRRPERPWNPAADALIASALSPELRAGFEPAHDIYYLVLDSLGRADALHRAYNVDLRPVVAALEARGFYVVERARSNYSQTYLSLASTLNLSYLDDVAEAVGTATRDRAPLGYLIQENALMQLASRAGYRTVVFGSDYMATERLDRADVCICSPSRLYETELAAIALTPLAAVPLRLVSAEDPYEGHRRKVVETFAALESYKRGPGRTLLFAHVLSPHAPFVLAKGGRPLPPPGRPFALAESGAEDAPRDEYISGYGQQTEYVLERTLAVIDAALAQPGPRPVIVVHGDHGPGLRLSDDEPLEESMQNRMEIFATYYLPDGNAGLYPTMTPVNGARLVARRYLGAALPPLPDRAIYSPFSRPYDFRPVPAAQDSISPVRIR